MIRINIRSGGNAGLHLAYAVGSFAQKDDAFVVNQIGGESPFGGVLCSLGSDYAVHMSPDGSGRSVFAGLDITTPLGNGKGWYVRDDASGEIWSPFFGPVCEKADEQEVAFSPGQATAYALKIKIATTLTVATLPDLPLEVWLVRIENRSAIERSLTFTTYMEPCIGSDLDAGYKEQENVLLMRRPLSASDSSPSPLAKGGYRGVGDMVLFHSSTLTPTRYQTEKSAFVGEGRSLRNPKELDSDQSTGTDGAAAKPIASLTVQIELPIEGEAEFAFCFGVAHSPEHAMELARGLSKTRLAKDAVENSRKRWEELTSALKIQSPDRSLNSLVNTWLPYEAYAGWIGQRTGGVCLDPASAADALRRCHALPATAPELCRESILSFAAGISTSGAYSPDSESVMMLPAEELLWLVTCTARYLAETGDLGVLAETTVRGDRPGLTLKEHCERAMKLCRDADGVSEAVLDATLELWSLVTGGAAATDLTNPSCRRRDDRPEHPEQRTLPRRVRYFQSVSPTLSDAQGRRELERTFDSDLVPDGDSSSACGAYATIERILGIQATSEGLLVRPHLPSAWAECEITREYRGDVYKIRLMRSMTAARKGISIEVDGDPISGSMVHYFGDGLEHTVNVVVA